MLYFTEVEGAGFKAKVFLYENLYTLFFVLRKIGLLDRSRTFYFPFSCNELKNSLGRFAFRSGTYDYTMLSSYYEERVLTTLRDLVEKHLRAGRRVLFLDIGAHLGRNCIALKNMFSGKEGLKCVAVEASSKNFSLLKKNAALNGLENDLILVNKAVFHKAGERVEFGYDPKNPGGSSLAGRRNSLELEIVETTAIDELIEMFSFEADESVAFVVKMDIEGAEEDTLRGASKLLTSKNEVDIVAEDQFNKNLTNILISNGFKVTRIDEENILGIRSHD